MEDRWSLFWTLVETKIQPVLEQAGFTRTEAGMSEEKPGEHPFFMYERAEDKLRASVDALEWVERRVGRDHWFKWIRVWIGRHKLRHLFPPPSSSNIYEEDGWVFVNQLELEQATDEIVELLRRHFNLSAPNFEA